MLLNVLRIDAPPSENNKRGLQQIRRHILSGEKKIRYNKLNLGQSSPSRQNLKGNNLPWETSNQASEKNR